MAMDIIESFALIAAITALFVWYGIAAGRREKGKAKFTGNDVAEEAWTGKRASGF
jgi:hypothetical protein